MAAAESKDGIGAANGPKHSGLFEALADHCCASGFDNARANEQMLLAKLGITHPPGVFLKVSGFGVTVSATGESACKERR